jgi:penicillin-binding protein 1A
MAVLRPWLRRLAKLTLACLTLGLVALGSAYWYFSSRLPDVEQLKHVELQVPLTVYSRDGKLIALIGETRRYPVKVANIPLPVRQAFIAIEDARFYHHHGLDFRGIARAVWLIATTDNQRVPGGSTITQQVARNFYLSTEYSFSRKFMEMFLALKMERELTKDEILELYLNKIFFGNRAYGVAAAAEYYYGKKLDQLTLGEAASLAAIPKFPSSANPIVNPARALIRRNYVLQRMQEVGFIDAGQAQLAQAEPMHAKPHEPAIEVEAPFLAEMVRQAMAERYGESSETSGLQVYTTVLSQDQQAADLAIRNGLIIYDRRHGWRGPEAHVELAASAADADVRAPLGRYNTVGGMPAAIVVSIDPGGAHVVEVDGATVVLDDKSCEWTTKKLQALLKRGDIIRVLAVKDGKFELGQIPKAEAALVSLQPENGALRALVGGMSFGRSKFNRVTQARRQPGSSFKPFLYSAAFEHGYTPASIVLDAPVVFQDRVGHIWKPQNDKGDFVGPIRLREALVQSRNLVSVRLLDAIGVDFARKYITRFGFSLDSLPANLSMSLGSASLTPMSVARGYAVFANGGFLIEPNFIDRIVDRRGVVIARPHLPRACRDCPQRLNSEASAGTVVDDFDFSRSGPAVAKAPDPSRQIGPPAEVLAPHAIDERTAFLARSLMLDVVLRGTATAAKVLNRADIGGKTGSTNDHRDAWFSGFGGDLVTTVWVGKDDFSSLGYKEYGGKAALPIWIDYMRVALTGVPINDATPPAGIVIARINPGTGGLVPDGTPGSIPEFFKSEDYQRLTSGGYQPQDSTEPESEKTFDIF